jgi:hypothetical protein
MPNEPKNPNMLIYTIGDINYFFANSTKYGIINTPNRPTAKINPIDSDLTTVGNSSD